MKSVEDKRVSAKSIEPIDRFEAELHKSLQKVTVPAKNVRKPKTLKALHPAESPSTGTHQ
jgi:hypothetical protein